VRRRRERDRDEVDGEEGGTRRREEGGREQIDRRL
jgi:hypothetical protein